MVDNKTHITFCFNVSFLGFSLMPELIDQIITKILINSTSIIHSHSLSRKSLSIIQITMQIILWASFMKGHKATFVETYTIRSKISTYLL